MGRQAPRLRPQPGDRQHQRQQHQGDRGGDAHGQAAEQREEGEHAGRQQQPRTGGLDPAEDRRERGERQGDTPHDRLVVHVRADAEEHHRGARTQRERGRRGQHLVERVDRAPVVAARVGSRPGEGPAPDPPREAPQRDHQHDEREQHRHHTGAAVERVGEGGGGQPQQRRRGPEVHVPIAVVFVALDREHAFGIDRWPSSMRWACTS